MRRRLIVLRTACVALTSCGQDPNPQKTTAAAPTTTTGILPPGVPTEGTRPPAENLPPPAEPQSAPAPTGPVPGRLVPVGAAPEGVVVDAVTRTVAVAKHNPNELVLINADTGAITGRTPLPGVVRHLQLAAPGGPVLVPVESANALVRVDLPAGRAEPQIVTGTVPHDAAQAQNGYVFVANEHGGTVTVLRGDEMIKVFTGSVQPAGMAPVGLSMGMLDVRKNDLTVYDAAALTIVGVTPAGEGPTHLVADKHGRMIAADTRGDAVRVFEPLPKPREVGVVKQPVVSQEKWLQDRPNGRQNPQITRKVGLGSSPPVLTSEIGAVLNETEGDARSASLDLIRRQLTRTGIREQMPLRWPLRRRLLLKTVNALNPMLMRTSPFGQRKRDLGLDWPADAETMIGMQRLTSLQRCVETVLADDIPGDLVECGVWRGGASILMRAVLAAYGDETRCVWLADSFAGVPPPDAANYKADKRIKLHRFASILAVSEAEVRANFQRYGLLDDQVRFLPGWFKDTLHDAPIERIAVLRLDGDLYESTIQALDALYPRLSPGGFCIIDDYHVLKACRKAVTDYRAKHGVSAEIVEIDGSGVLWRK